MTLQRPKIWLLTGVYLIEDATTWTVTNRSSGALVAGSVPLPDPTALTTLVGLNPSLHYEVGKNFVRREGTQILGRKVWAAQYQLIKAKYVTVAEGTELPVDRIKLLSILSTQKSRGEGNVIDLHLSDDFALEKLEEDDVQVEKEFTKDYWKDFETEVKELEEELADG
jgi:hypothetical protein